MCEPTAHYDFKLLFPVLFLVGIGIVMVYSASSALALKKFGSDSFFLKKQAVFAFMGIAALVVCRHIPLKIFRSLAYPLLFFAFFLLLFIQVTDFNLTAGGATRWLHIGSFTFQPSEFARFAMVIYLSYSLSKKSESPEKIGDFFIGFLPHFIILCIMILLILLQPDFGSAVILGMVTWCMMFVGGVRIKHLVLPLLMIIPCVLAVMVNASYRLERLISFWDPWQYATDGGYQIIHSLMAFGSGGVWGAGLGKGFQKLFYLPEPHTDFIFSVIGEELGLAGILFVLAFYGVIIWKGISITINARDQFSTFLAAGLTITLGLQVCVNMGVALALLPTKGLTLPFLSYGGTSLILSMASIGLLMNVWGNRPLKEEES